METTVQILFKIIELKKSCTKVGENMKNLILDFAKENNGIVYTKDVGKIGVRREELKKLTDEGRLVKVKRANP